MGKKLLKVGIITSHLPFTLFSCQHTAVVLADDCKWDSMVYGVQKFPSFGCFTNTLSPTRILESLIGILLSARIFILSFWYESCSSIRAGFRLALHRSAAQFDLDRFPKGSSGSNTSSTIRSCFVVSQELLHPLFPVEVVRSTFLNVS